MRFDEPLKPTEAAGIVLEDILNSQEKFDQLKVLKPDTDEYKTGNKVFKSIYDIKGIGSLKEKVYQKIGFCIDRSLENPDNKVVYSLGKLVNHYLGSSNNQSLIE